MKRLIAGATGFIGQSLVQGWLNKRMDVVVVGRSKEKINKLFHQKVEAVTWEELADGVVDPKGLEAVVNLSGAGIADQRWTAKRKKEIIDSRVKATRAVVDFCLKNKTPLLNTSAVGIYGIQEINPDRLPSAYDEDSRIPGNEAKDFLSKVCRLWEQAAQPLKEANVRTVNLRLGVVLGKDGGALDKMALPFYLFAGGPIGSGHQPVPWISLKDVCRAINFIIEKKEMSGPVNLVAPECVKQRDLAKALGKSLKRPSFLPTPGFVLKFILGDLADELLLNGQHVRPKRLEEYGFTFQYPDIQSTFNMIHQK